MKMTQRTGGRACVLIATAAATLAGGTAKPALAQTNPIRVFLDGTSLDFGRVPPISVNNRVMVPMRRVFEALGAQVNYDAGTQTIRAENGASHIRLRLGSTQAFVNGHEENLDVAAQSSYGRTLVPLRFVSESLGADVKWDEYKNAVFIHTAGGNRTGGDAGGDRDHRGSGDNRHGRDGQPPAPTDNGQTMTFNGTVTSVDVNANLLMVQTRAGETRTVKADNAADFRKGDVVHVEGELRRDIVRASSVERRGNGR